jgi:hypothetical protein
MTSRIAIRNNANCNKITGTIYIQDETGNTVTRIPVPWLHPKHMKIVDLAYFGQLPRGFVGAARFEVEGREQLCDTDADGHTDNTAIMPSVVVLNYGYETELPIGNGAGAGPWTQVGGDVTRVYEAFPYTTDAGYCEVDFLGKVHNYDPGLDTDGDDDVNAVDLVYVAESGDLDFSTLTNSTGDYELEGIEITPDDTDKELTFFKGGWLTATVASSALTCGEDEVLDCELLCMVDIKAYAYTSDMDTGEDDVVRGATVNYSVSGLPKATAGSDCGYDSVYRDSTTTKLSDGSFTMTVPLIDATLTYTIERDSQYFETRVFTVDFMDTTNEAGSYGSVLTAGKWVPNSKAADEWSYSSPDFNDEDCPNFASADPHKEIPVTSPQRVCQYGQVSGRVCVDVDATPGVCDGDDAPYIGKTVVATRLYDNEVVATTTTDANGNYQLRLPTGHAANTTAAEQKIGHEYEITVDGTDLVDGAVDITFLGCGQSFGGQDFAF